MLPFLASGPGTNGGDALYEWSTVRLKDPAQRMHLLGRSSARPARLRSPVLSSVATACRIVAACLLVVMATEPRAAAQEIRGGVRAGPTFGFLSESATPFTGTNVGINANLRLDLHAGAYAIVPVTEQVSLQPELLYIRKGGHFSRPRSESYAVERYQLSYLQGGLLSRRDISIPGPVSFYTVAGLSINVALSGTLRRNLRAANLDFEEQVALMETAPLRRWDLGVLLGVGFGYPVGTAGRAALELRYNRGLRSVFGDAGRPEDTPPDGFEEVFPLTGSALRHDVITASLSYTVPL